MDWIRMERIVMVIFGIGLVIFMGFIFLEAEKRHITDICQECGSQNFTGYINHGMVIACDEIPAVYKCP